MPTTVDRRPTAGTDPTPRRRVDLRRITLWTLVRVGAVVAAVLCARWAVHKYGRSYSFFDMKIYHGAMVWWTSGHDLYQFVAPKTTLGFTYPPFAALVMAPMALLPTMAAGWVNTVISVAALALVLTWVLVPVADRYGWPRWFTVALAVPLAWATEPVRETLGFGQVNLLLAALIYADVVALKHRSKVASGTATPSGGTLRRLWTSGALAGVGVGLAAAIKVTPALFIGYFVVTRQWRAAIVSAVTAVGATLLTFLVMGGDAATYFTSILFDTGRIGEVDATANQSLAGLLARLYDSPTTPTLMWLSFAMLLLAVGMTRAATAHREGDETAAFTLVGLTANAISPISWSHHLVFLVPALVILMDTALRRRSAARGFATRGAFTRGPGGIPALAGLPAAIAALGIYAVFVVSPIWRYEHKLSEGVSHYHDGFIGALGENSLVLIIIALIALLPWRAGAEPAFYPEPALARRRAAAAAIPD
ncbi:MAG TPA: glycosyltransferase 87 family protein [Rugosimonospora sp.]|nr:glycosyltransferase 87 family protein [Rugosimonospora sp.]